MNQLRPGPNQPQATGPDTKAGTATPSGNQNASGAPATFDAVVGPFTVRDLTVFGSVLLMFVASLLPMFGGLYNLWSLGSLFFLLLGIILPVAVVALFVARRLRPEVSVRVGSLSIDQFASVTAAFATLLFFLTVAVSFNASALLGLVGSLGLLAATVLGPHLPFLSADFKGRTETTAHLVARPAAVPTRKPSAPKEPKAPKEGKSSPGFSIPGFRNSSTAPNQGGTSGVVHPAAPGVAGTSVGAPQATPYAQPEAPASPAVQSPSAPTPSEAAAAPAPAAAGTGAVASQSTPATQSPSVAQASPAAPQAASGQDEKSASAQEPATTQHATQQAKQPAAADQAAATSQPAAPSQPETAAQPAANQQAQQAAAQAAPQQPSSERSWAATMATPIVSGDTRTVSDSIGATVDPASRPEESNDAPHYEAFWFAVGQPRTAFDERTGAPAFVIEPGGWVLALEDRGHEFLVQDTDGKVGVLRELSNIERG